MNQSFESGSIPWANIFLLPHRPHHAVVVTVALLALALRHSGQATPARALCAPVSQSIVDARDREASATLPAGVSSVGVAPTRGYIEIPDGYAATRPDIGDGDIP
jgi:hypothetical protein